MSKIKKFFHSLHSVLNPFRSHPANLLLAFGITWIYVLFIRWITGPLVVTDSPFDRPETWQTTLRTALLVPGFIFMLYHLFIHLDFLEGFRFFFFPLLAFSIAFWLYVLASGGGSTAAGIASIFLFIPMVVIIPGSFIIGMVLDIPVFISAYKRKRNQS
jgi:hypothetical protein